jgi:hypothetical protein
MGYLWKLFVMDGTSVGKSLVYGSGCYIGVNMWSLCRECTNGHNGLFVCFDDFGL